MNFEKGRTATGPEHSETAQEKPNVAQGQAAARLISVRLEPREVTLWGSRCSQRFLVLGKYSDGQERDVTLKSQFSVSDSRIAKVDAGGRVAALSDGEVILWAERARSAGATPDRAQRV